MSHASISPWPGPRRQRSELDQRGGPSLQDVDPTEATRRNEPWTWPWLAGKKQTSDVCVFFFSDICWKWVYIYIWIIYLKSDFGSFWRIVSTFLEWSRTGFEHNSIGNEPNITKPYVYICTVKHTASKQQNTRSQPTGEGRAIWSVVR